MTLTGQVFTLMGGIATDIQAQEMIRSVDHYLFDASFYCDRHPIGIDLSDHKSFSA